MANRNPLLVPPMAIVTKPERRAAMLRAWRRAELDGSWWGLLGWLDKQQLPFGEPTYQIIERWTHADMIEPVEGVDYSGVPVLPTEPLKGVDPYPRPVRGRLD